MVKRETGVSEVPDSSPYENFSGRGPIKQSIIMMM